MTMTSETTQGITVHPLVERGNIIIKGRDSDALEIGESIRKAKASVAESLRHLIEAGRLLSRKRDDLGYGKWLPWLKANADVLGFDTPRTAQRLISFSSKHDVNVAFGENEALQISRKLWGNDHAFRAQGTGDNEWFTPSEYIEAARDALGEIDLDPASHEDAQTTIKAARYFTQSDNGLTKEWHGRVWLNPPYAQPLISQFVEKLIQEYGSGRTTAAIMLTHNNTDTEWFHNAASVARAVCFTKGRIRFYKADGEIAAPTN